MWFSENAKVMKLVKSKKKNYKLQKLWKSVCNSENTKVRKLVWILENAKVMKLVWYLENAKVMKCVWFL